MNRPNDRLPDFPCDKAANEIRTIHPAMDYVGAALPNDPVEREHSFRDSGRRVHVEMMQLNPQVLEARAVPGRTEEADDYMVVLSVARRQMVKQRLGTAEAEVVDNVQDFQLHAGTPSDFGEFVGVEGSCSRIPHATQ